MIDSCMATYSQLKEEIAKLNKSLEKCNSNPNDIAINSSSNNNFYKRNYVNLSSVPIKNDIIDSREKKNNRALVKSKSNSLFKK